MEPANVRIYLIFTATIELLVYIFCHR